MDALNKIEEQAKSFRLITSFSGIMFYQYDLKKNKYVFFENVKEVLGYTCDELSQILQNKIDNNDIRLLSHPDDYDILQKAHDEFVKNGESRFEVRLKCANGEYHWFFINRQFVCDDKGARVSVIGCILSADVFYKKMEKLRQQAILEPMTGLVNKVSAQTLIDDAMADFPNSTHALIFFDMDNFKKVNDTLGHSMGDRVIQYIADTLKSVFDDNAILSRFGGDEFLVFIPEILSRNDVVKKAREFNKIIKECAMIKNTDITIAMSIGIAFSEDGISSRELLDRADKAAYAAKRQGKARYCIYGDEKLEVTKSTLSLGIYDRFEFLRIVDEKMQLHDDLNYCLVAIDIEHFKLFNRWYGRDKGDVFLEKITDFLLEFQEKYDAIAGYFGADNFAVLMSDNPSQLDELENGCKNVALKMVNSVGFLPSYGIYRITDKNVSSAAMYDFATVALGYSVGNYITRSCVYTPSMTHDIERDLDLITELEEALKQEHITFYLQPKVNIISKKIVGAEVLSRWIHPKKGIIPPLEFIPILEKNGFVSNLDKYIWEKVCKTARKLLDEGLKLVPVSVNVSRIDMLSIDVVEYLKQITDKYNISRDLIRIEITESAYGDNTELIQKTILKLKEYGFSIFMDDFGSGYSSLNNLKNLYLDGLKIDMKFLEIDRMEEEKGLRILESVVMMAHSIGLPVIVEGVETKKQEEYLCSLNCLFGQGFYYYKPMPLENFIEIIKDEKHVDYEGIITKWKKMSKKDNI